MSDARYYIRLYEHFWSAKARSGFVKIVLPTATIVAQIAELTLLTNSHDAFVKLAPTDVYGMPTPVSSFKLSDIKEIESIVLLDVKIKKSADIKISSGPYPKKLK